jgi:1-acyl-sn-glycerol-3-phosphate acyltransferase
LHRRIAELALERLGVPADDIVLADARIVLKTSSGKIRRSACRELYERGVLGAGQRPVALQLARLALSGAAGSLRRLGRRTRDMLYAAYLWVLFSLAALLGGAVLCLIPSAKRRDRWTRFVARLLVRLSVLELQVHGSAPLGPAIFVANHASYVDSLILSALLPPGAHFAAKRELARVPVLGWLLGRVGTRFVERFEAREAIEGARGLAEAARAGEPLVVYPEGTFIREAGLQAFHMGAFVAAAQSSRPVVPVTLIGTRSVLRAYTWLPRRQRVEVFIDAPLAAAGSGWSDALVLRDQCRRVMLSHSPC